ncbi:MAG: hypothetical protein P8J55_02220 [Pseudomonadales bacterium]|nr:hypothetical protein [Pseudomonadales bacterium]
MTSQNWNATNRIDRIAQLANSYREPRNRGRVMERQHPTCQIITDHFDQIKNDRSLTDKIKTMTRFKQEARQTRKKLNNVRSAYETKLPEVDSKSSTATLQREVIESISSLDTLIEQENQTREAFANDEKLVRLFEHLERLTNDDRENLAEEYRDLAF